MKFYLYDTDHRLTSRQTTSKTPTYQKFSYDARDRKTEMWWGTTSDTTNHTDDITWANGITHNNYAYDAAGNLTTANNAFSAVSRKYDEADRLLNDIQTVTNSTTYDVQYTPDQDGKVTAVSIPSTYNLGIIYDPMGRLWKLNNSSLGTFAQYSYDPASNIMERDSSTNNSKLVEPRDALNRMYRRDVVLGATTISSESYGFDPMSRLQSVSRTDDGSSDSFSYYQDGELKTAQYVTAGSTPTPTPTPGPTPTPTLKPTPTPTPTPRGGVPPTMASTTSTGASQRNVTYTLDKAGNRTNVSDNGVNTPYSPDNINRYTQVGTSIITGGPEHEVGAYQTNAYLYVSDTFLAKITAGSNSYTLYYDALGRCVKRTSTGVNAGTTNYVYDGDKPILESGATSATNVYGVGIDEIVLRTVGSINYYYYEDHEGSITHVANGNALAEKYRYDAFGAPSIFSSTGQPLNSSTINNRFLFTGREYTATFGIYEYRNRAYHPGLGRFMSEDPKGFAAGDYNLFRYVHNDPEDLTDPMGLIAQEDPPPPPKYVMVLGSHIPQLSQRLDMAEKNLIMGSAGSAQQNTVHDPVMNGKNYLQSSNYRDLGDQTGIRAEEQLMRNPSEHEELSKIGRAHV